MLMKNKIFYIIFWTYFLLSQSFSSENYFNFKTQNIEIIDNGKLINAYNGKAISKDGEFEILAEKFQYIKESKILKIEGNGIILQKQNNFKIQFEQGIINEKELMFEAFGKVLVENKNNGLKIRTEKLNLNYKDNILTSELESQISDDLENLFIVEKFKYEIQNNLLKLKNLKLIDKNNNTFELSNAYFNTKNNNLFGKDLFLKLDNKNQYKENEPRLRGNVVTNNENTTSISGGVFTTCKKRDGCPPWQISAKKIEHEKKKKTIKYEDAILKIYDFPVAYFPKFSHPDPTVKRQSGFLTPSLKRSTNKKNYFELPYYFVISDNKDTTFLPRFYNDEQFLFQNEFRSVKSNSSFISDFSFKIDDYNKLKSHFFYEYNKSFNLDNYIENDFVVKLQKTSKDTYLKKNKINSSITFDNNNLENSIKFNFSKQNIIFNIEGYAYENLNSNDSDRYEYILPKINVSKKINNNTKLNGDFFLNSKVINKNYNTNILETINTNDLKFESLPTITKKGFYNNYEFIFKNANTNAKNSKSIKNKSTNYLSSLVQFNSSIPLQKNSKNFTKSLTPKLSIKMAPDYNKNSKNIDNTLSTDNIYSFNRYSEQDTLEGGISAIYGSEYSIFDKKKSINIFQMKIANNLRTNKNEDLPRNSQFHETISSIVNEISISPNSIFDVNYKSSLKNNFDDINYEQLISKISINNLVTTFEYYNDNESSNKNSYLTNSTTLRLNKSNSLSFSTRKNKTIDLTEYYNLAYSYKNDCLTASIEYNKDYYLDRDIKPDEGIFFKLSIISSN
jgi:LPS-assembly protein